MALDYSMEINMDMDMGMMGREQQLRYIVRHARVLTDLLSNMEQLRQMVLSSDTHDQLIAQLNELASTNPKQLRFLMMTILNDKHSPQIKISIVSFIHHYIVSNLLTLNNADGNVDDYYNKESQYRFRMGKICPQFGQGTRQTELCAWINVIQILFKQVKYNQMDQSNAHRFQHETYLPKLCQSYIKLIICRHKPIDTALRKLLGSVQFHLTKNRNSLAVYLVQAIASCKQLHIKPQQTLKYILYKEHKVSVFVNADILYGLVLVVLKDVHKLYSVLNESTEIQSCLDYVLGQSVKINPILLNQMSVINWILTNLEVDQLFNQTNLRNMEKINKQARDMRKHFTEVIRLGTEIINKMNWPIYSMQHKVGQLDELCSLLVRWCWLLLPYIVTNHPNDCDCDDDDDDQQSEHDDGSLLDSIVKLASNLFTFCVSNNKQAKNVNINTTINRNVVNLLVRVIQLGASSNLSSNGSKNIHLNLNSTGSTYQQYINSTLLNTMVNHFTIVLHQMLGEESMAVCKQFVAMIVNTNINNTKHRDNNGDDDGCNDNDDDEVLDCLGVYGQPLWLGYARLITALAHHFSQLTRILTNKYLAGYSRQLSSTNPNPNNAQLTQSLAIGCIFNSILCTQPDYLAQNRQLLCRCNNQLELQDQPNMMHRVLWLLNAWCAVDDVLVGEQEGGELVRTLVNRISISMGNGSGSGCVLEMVLCQMIIVKYYTVYKFEYGAERANIQAILLINTDINININANHNNCNNCRDIVIKLQLLLLEMYGYQIQLQVLVQWINQYQYQYKYQQKCKDKQYNNNNNSNSNNNNNNNNSKQITHININRQQSIQVYRVIAKIMIHHIDSMYSHGNINMDLNNRWEYVIQLYRHNIISQIVTILTNNHNTDHGNRINQIQNMGKFIMNDPKFQLSCQLLGMGVQIQARLGIMDRIHKLVTTVLHYLVQHIFGRRSYAIYDNISNTNHNTNSNNSHTNRQYSNYVQYLITFTVQHNLIGRYHPQMIPIIWDTLVHMLTTRMHQDMQVTVKVIILLHAIVRHGSHMLNYTQVKAVMELVLKECNRKIVRLYRDSGYFYRGKLYTVFVLLLQHCPEHSAAYLLEIKSTSISDVTQSYRNLLSEVFCKSASTYRDEYDYQHVVHALSRIFMNIMGDCGRNGERDEREIEKVKKVRQIHVPYIHLYLKAMVECAVAWWNHQKIIENQQNDRKNNNANKNKATNHKSGSNHNNISEQPSSVTFRAYEHIVHGITSKIKGTGTASIDKDTKHQQQTWQQFCEVFQALHNTKYQWLQQIVYIKKLIDMEDIAKVHAVIMEMKHRSQRLDLAYSINDTNTNTSKGKGKRVYHSIAKSHDN